MQRKKRLNDGELRLGREKKRIKLDHEDDDYKRGWDNGRLAYKRGSLPDTYREVGGTRYEQGWKDGYEYAAKQFPRSDDEQDAVRGAKAAQRKFDIARRQGPDAVNDLLIGCRNNEIPRYLESPAYLKAFCEKVEALAEKYGVGCSESKQVEKNTTQDAIQDKQSDEEVRLAKRAAEATFWNYYNKGKLDTLSDSYRARLTTSTKSAVYNAAYRETMERLLENYNIQKSKEQKGVYTTTLLVTPMSAPYGEPTADMKKSSLDYWQGRTNGAAAFRHNARKPRDSKSEIYKKGWWEAYKEEEAIQKGRGISNNAVSGQKGKDGHSSVARTGLFGGEKPSNCMPGNEQRPAEPNQPAKFNQPERTMPSLVIPIPTRLIPIPIRPRLPSLFNPSGNAPSELHSQVPIKTEKNTDAQAQAKRNTQNVASPSPMIKKATW